MTSLGKIRLNRRVYQKDSGGKAEVPLDRMWNMEHQYLSAELKEGVLYSSAHNTQEETSRILDKFGMTSVHASTIKKAIDQVGQNIEVQKEQITQGIYDQESLPQESDVMVCSLDGVNVLLNQKGKRKGRQKREILKSSPGAVDKLIQSAKYCIRSRLTRKSKTEGAIKELKYFTNHRSMMRYHFFVHKGWPIGSGVVEAACKSIVKQRMCRSGQRWTVTGGQNILSLRSYVKSERWDYLYKTLEDINHKMCA